MRKYLIGLLLCLIPCFVWADVDTWDGVTGIDTFDGQTGIAKICGQTVASGGACDTVVYSQTDALTASIDIKDDVTRTMVGLLYQNAAEKSICKIGFYL